MTNTVNNEGLSAKDLLLAFIVSIVLMFLAGSGYAQGIGTAKAGDATEVATAAKEVKSTLAVPAKLAKAMNAAKDRVGKKVGKKVSNIQTFERWYNVTVTGDPNMPSGLTVTGASIPEPPANGACALLNGGNPCAVKLIVNSAGYTFGSSSYTLNALPAGATLPSSPQYAKSIIEDK